jgi:uncharacterized membrane protein HdeD (DUF308 family)
MRDHAELRRSDRTALRLAAVLLIVGIVITALAGLLHPEGAAANDHPATFAVYADSGIWTAVHLGQFVGIATLIAGLGALFFALDPRRGPQLWLNRAALLAAIVALALYGVLQAVDGVALKQAVDAWAAAPGPEKAARFASAETVRWLEWAVRSYHSFMFGAALILFGATIAATRRVTRAIGYLMALSGLAYLAQGWILGMSGFSSANGIPTLLGIVLVVAWAVWLLIDALRARVGQPEATDVEALV